MPEAIGILSSLQIGIGAIIPVIIITESLKYLRQSLGTRLLKTP